MVSSITPWRLVVLTLVVACVGIAPTFWLLWPKWMDSFTYSHGLLVIPLSAWLLWRERDRINAEPVQRTRWAGLLLLGLLFVWTLSFASSIEIGTSATMPLILLVAVLFAAGSRIAMISAFPVLLLYSAIPVWDYINGILQSTTTAAVTIILDTLQVPAYIQGNVVQIPSGVFEIAGGCSGLHFFIVGFTLAAVYGHLYLSSMRNRVVLLGVAVAMAIVMNWIRVATIIVAGHMTNMQSFLVQVDHYYFGWVLFAVILIPFFLIARWLEGREDNTEEDTIIGETLVPANATLAAIASVCVISLLPVLVWGRLVQNEPAPVIIELPGLAEWQGPSEGNSNWQPVFRGADGEALASYSRDGRSLEVYVNWYRSQSQSRELIGYGNSLAGHNVRRHYDRKYIDITARNDAKSLEIREILTSNHTGQRRLIWYYFVVGDHAETNAIRAKLTQGLRSFVGNYSTGLISVSAACDLKDSGCAIARQLLREEFAGIDRIMSDTLCKLDDA